MSEALISIENAIEKLKAGDVVAVPTETVYGLAGSIESEKALNKIFSTKKRPFFDPLIVHIASIEMAKSLVIDWPKVAQVLAEKFWPGPLTMVLPKNKKVSDLITAEHNTVGLRWPKHPITVEIIRKLNQPIAAPSANLFGKTSPTEAKHVVNEFESAVSVVDGGPCDIGLESTVVGILENQICIYRPGAISKTDLEKALSSAGLDIKVLVKSSPVAPGQLKTHYQPKVPVIIFETELGLELYLKNEMGIALDDCAVLNNKNLEPWIFARSLYADLRSLAESHPAILVRRSPKHSGEAWSAIWNRLEKAAICIWQGDQ